MHCGICGIGRRERESYGACEEKIDVHRRAVAKNAVISKPHAQIILISFLRIPGIEFCSHSHYISAPHNTAKAPTPSSTTAGCHWYCISQALSCLAVAVR